MSAKTPMQELEEVFLLPKARPCSLIPIRFLEIMPTYAAASAFGNALMMHGKPSVDSETAYITDTGPEGQLNLIPITMQDDGDSTSMPVVTAGENLTTIYSDTTVEFLPAAD